MVKAGQEGARDLGRKSENRKGKSGKEREGEKSMAQQRENKKPTEMTAKTERELEI